MIATTHLAVGAAVGLWIARLVDMLADMLLIQKPSHVRFVVKGGATFVVATASHFLLDAIPHDEDLYASMFGKWPVLLTELVVIFNIIFWICYVRDLDFLIVFLGMAGAAWPDAIRMVNIPGLSGSYLLHQIEGFHDCVHSYITPGLMPSLPIQVLVAVIALLFLF